MDSNKQIFTEIIKRQMALLGPQITLSKVKNVPGIQVSDSGDVINITGDSQVLLQQLINQFIELSGLIVKKTMESIMAAHPNDALMMGQMPIMTVDYKSAPIINADSPSLSDLPTSASQFLAPQEQKIESKVSVQPSVSQPTPEESRTNVNKDIEDLNKMLNTSNNASEKQVN